jgi:hypothetical protein
LLRSEREDAKTLELTFAGQALAPGQSTSWGPNGGEKLRLHFANWDTGWEVTSFVLLVPELRLRADF